MAGPHHAPAEHHAAHPRSRHPLRDLWYEHHQTLGGVYKNNADDWEWLQGVISNARWLGYVDWDQIRDQRNETPEVRMWTPPSPEPFVAVDFEVYLPSAEDLRPQARINGFTGTQPYHLVMVGEKASLRDVLAPIA